jgi:hypothetical protein
MGIWDLGRINPFYSGSTARAGDMAQVAEHLPTKCKVPSSNPSTVKKKPCNSESTAKIYLLVRYLIPKERVKNFWLLRVLI